MTDEEPTTILNRLAEGDVIQYRTPYQSKMFLRQQSDVGNDAYRRQHPNSNVFKHDATVGRLMAEGIVCGAYAKVTDVLSLEEAQSGHGVFIEENND